MSRILIFKDKLPKQFKISTNKIYSGMHFRQRKKLKDSFFSYYKIMLMKHRVKPINTTIKLEFIFSFKTRLLDSSNCSYMAKMFEDTLVTTGILKDDSPKYIRSVEYCSRKACKGEVDNFEVYIED
jgi:hypothetical protein